MRKPSLSWTFSIAAHSALRPQPFYLGIVIAVIGLAVSILFVRETRPYAHLEAATAPQTMSSVRPSLGHVFYVTTLGNVSLFAACQAGLVNNLNDGMSWGLYPLFFASYGVPSIYSSDLVTPPAAGIRDGAHRRVAPPPPCPGSAAVHSEAQVSL